MGDRQMKETNPKNKIIFPIGKDDYKKVIDEKCVYIDKTLLIKEFWEDGAEVILITRPRRFGKTIALSMLRYFFEKTEISNAYLFEKSQRDRAHIRGGRSLEGGAAA